MLYLLITGFDGDVEAALTELGELAVSRSASLPPPPQSERVLTEADVALEAQFPDAVSGEPLAIEWLSGPAFVAGLPEGVAALAEGLVAEQGKTLDDVTVASASSTQGSILAMRLAGGDALAFFGPLLADMYTGDPYVDLDEHPGGRQGRENNPIRVRDRVLVPPGRGRLGGRRRGADADRDTLGSALASGPDGPAAIAH